MKVDWGCACGRYYLEIDGLVVAVEGDMCRDVALTSKFNSNHWNGAMIKAAAERGKEIFAEFKESLDKPFASLTDLNSEEKYLDAKKKEREEISSFHAEHLAKTVCAVEATYNEMSELWAKHASDSPITQFWGNDKKPIAHDRRVKQVGMGLTEHLGDVAKMPVMLTGFWYYYDDRLVFFWEQTSMITDGRLAEKWLERNLPKDCYKTDANNFHNALGHIDKLNNKDLLESDAVGGKR